MRSNLIARLLTLIFAVILVPAAFAQAPNDKVVAELTVRNNRLVATNQILNTIKTRVDKKYDHATVQNDVSALMATKSFTNVQASFEPTPDGKVKVIFDVAELPNVVTEIRFEGAKSGTITTSTCEFPTVPTNQNTSSIASSPIATHPIDAAPP